MIYTEQIDFKNNIKDIAIRCENAIKAIELLDKTINNTMHTCSLLQEHCGPHIREFDKEKLIENINYQAWKQVLTISEIERFMTSIDFSKMLEKLHEKPPVFNYKDAIKLIETVIKSHEAIASNMIKKIYDHITNMSFRTGPKSKRNFGKRNSFGFKIMLRATLFYSGRPSYIHSNDAELAYLKDLERVCDLVSNGIQKRYEGSIEPKIIDAFRNDEDTVICEHFSVVFYKNGNVIIKFFNKDTINKLNLWGSRKDVLPNLF